MVTLAIGRTFIAKTSLVIRWTHFLTEEKFPVPISGFLLKAGKVSTEHMLFLLDTYRQYDSHSAKKRPHRQNKPDKFESIYVRFRRSGVGSRTQRA